MLLNIEDRKRKQKKRAELEWERLRDLLIQKLILQIIPIVTVIVSFLVYCITGFIAVWVLDTVSNIVTRLLMLKSYSRYYFKMCGFCRYCCRNVSTFPDNDSHDGQVTTTAHTMDNRTFCGNISAMDGVVGINPSLSRATMSGNPLHYAGHSRSCAEHSHMTMNEFSLDLTPRHKPSKDIIQMHLGRYVSDSDDAKDPELPSTESPRAISIFMMKMREEQQNNKILFRKPFPSEFDDAKDAELSSIEWPPTKLSAVKMDNEKHIAKRKLPKIQKLFRKFVGNASSNDAKAPKPQLRSNALQKKEPSHHSEAKEDVEENLSLTLMKQSTFINEFTYEHTATEYVANSNEFGFGVYLEYWQEGCENSVIPKYKDLQEELTKNCHATISAKQYYDLTMKCNNILERNLNSFIAKNIGKMNQRCGIPPGITMTIEHAICLKLYTDFSQIQKEFKRHCRKLYKEEPIESVVKRNSEIAHWCRRFVRSCSLTHSKTSVKNNIAILLALTYLV